MKYYIIILFLVLLSSCKDEEKYNFIYNVLNNPDSLEFYLQKSSFIYGNNIYSKGFLSDINQQIKLIKSYRNEFLNKEFDIYEDRKYIVHDVVNRIDIITGPYHDITLKGKKGTKLRFTWLKNGDKWEFIGFDLVGRPF